MNSRERESLDRHITGNYGEDQFRDEAEETAPPNPGPWHVRPDYGKENVYRLWNEGDNYFAATDPETMDANAYLMAAAPDLLEACKAVMEAMEHIEKTDEFPDGVCPADLYTLAYEAIAKAEGRA
jgi:hypothetical protein